MNGKGVKGYHANVAIMDEAQDFEAVDPADLLQEATEGLASKLESDPDAVMEAFRQAVERQKQLRQRAVTCPFCQGGMAFSAHSALWGHNCWVCGGWGLIGAGMTAMRGPFAPRPRRQNV